jgi:hypothetical protein
MSRAAAGLALALTACAGFQPVSDIQPCLEVGYALAAITETCSGDRAAGNARYQQFREEYRCIPTPVEPKGEGSTEGTSADESEGAAGPAPEDLYDCAFAVEQLPCDFVEAAGDDLEVYLSVSPGCPLVAEPKGEGAR